MSKSEFDEQDELAKILGLTEADPERKKAKPDQTKADGPSPEDSEFYPNFSEDDPDFSDEEIPARKEDIPAAEEKPATEGSASEGKSSPSPVSKPPAPPKPPEPRRASSSEDDFIKEWEMYGQARTDAPREFHQIASLVLVATAINRNRWLDLQHKQVYPSLFAICLADSGQRKSTPIAYAVEACPKELRLANDYSPEALIADLDRRDQARGTVFVDEAGRLLNTMRKQGYGEGLKDLLSKLWDGPDDEERKLQKGNYHLKSTYLNLLMATTTSRFVDLVTPEDILSGFLARFLPILVTEKVQRRPVSRLKPATREEGERLAQHLLAMMQRLAKEPGAMEITNEALEALDAAEEKLQEWASGEWHSDLILPWATRLAEYGFRLAIIFAVSVGQDSITVSHAEQALLVVDRAKQSAKLLAERLTMDKDMREAEKLFNMILRNPGIKRRDAYRRATLSANRVDYLARELKAQGRIKISTDGKTELYFPADPDSPE